MVHLVAKTLAEQLDRIGRRAVPMRRIHPDNAGHAIGMSTVMECIAARWAGLEVAGVSLVTNAGAGYSGEPLTHEEVMAAGAEAGPRLARVIRRFVSDL